jgi:hypothetical protein
MEFGQLFLAKITIRGENDADPTNDGGFGGSIRLGLTVRWLPTRMEITAKRDRRRILQCQVTSHPTSAWGIQQLRETFPYDSAPGYLIFDHGPQFDDEVIAR